MQPQADFELKSNCRWLKNQKIRAMTTRHILVVEDEEKITRLLCDYLQAAGFRTSTQADGDRVIAQVKNDMPDLINFPMFPSS
jgi:PleD family two-component response regulator